MGIKGLLQNLNIVNKKVSLLEFKGKTAAIDAYAWLHKGLYSANGAEIMDGNYVSLIKYCLDRANILQREFGIEPIFVFDGADLPIKKGTNSLRLAKRNEAMKQLDTLAKKNLLSKTDTRSLYASAIDVSPEIASHLICSLRRKRLRYVVAPYEADAQMTYLCNMGIVDIVITEDQDLITFGCRQILFKVDFKSRTGDHYLRKNLLKSDKKLFNLTSFTFEMFQDMCILSGCDYLKNIKSIGLKRAYDLINRRRSYTSAINQLLREGKYDVPIDYIENFVKAKLCFKYQRVFDGLIEYREDAILKMIPLSPFAGEIHVDDESIGPLFEKKLILKISSGQLDPFTYEELFESESIPSVSPTKVQKRDIRSMFFAPKVPETSKTPTSRRQKAVETKFFPNSPRTNNLDSLRKSRFSSFDVQSTGPKAQLNISMNAFMPLKKSTNYLSLTSSKASAKRFKAPRRVSSKNIFKRYEFVTNTSKILDHRPTVLARRIPFHCKSISFSSISKK